MKNYLSVTCLALALIGCSAAEDLNKPQEESARAPLQHKSSAPVAVEVLDLGAAHARIKLTSQRRAKDVTVQVYGIDGLKVLSTETPIQKQSFAAGASQLLDVRFMPGEGRSHIAVHITGEFAGIVAVRATTIQVGGDLVGATASQVEDSEVKIDSKGQRVHVTNASEKK